MITAVDTNVLLDLFLGDPRHGPASRNWLRDAYDRGAILVCDIVYAELAPAFRDCGLDDPFWTKCSARSVSTIPPSTPPSRMRPVCVGANIGIRVDPERASYQRIRLPYRRPRIGFR